MDFAAYAATVDFGRASAAKRGRNPKFPYVPVVIHDVRPNRNLPDLVVQQTENPNRGLAFATRDEAVAHAQTCINARRNHLALNLAKTNMRALRAYHGFPREIGEQTDEP